MGHAYTYRCINCFYSKHLTEGVGMMMHPMPLEVFLENNSYVHYKIRKKLIEIAREYPTFLIETEYNIYQCKNCGCISSKLDIEIGGGMIYKSVPRCSHCRSKKVEPYEDSLDKTEKCPKCKQQTLKCEEIIMWD